jgi:hypothetical protein
VDFVEPRPRILAFGSAGLLVVAGAACAVFISGVLGSSLAIALISLGLGGALLLVFFEVGLSEDHDREREEERRRRLTARRKEPRRQPLFPRRPRRPG